MKNIQVIDGALNCTYSIFAIDDKDFDILFPNGIDIEFIDDLVARLGKAKAGRILKKVWKQPVDKKCVNGIHATLFYELEHKKEYYPTKREDEMIVVI